MTPRVVLLDSGGANLGSVQAAFARLGVEAPVTSDEDVIGNATHVVLPGVGAAAACMAKLRENGLDQLIPKITKPLIGICVGMQLLYERSDESRTECLGLLEGEVRLLPSSQGIRVPHMGWNRLDSTSRAGHPLMEGLEGASVYFVHSYAALPSPDALATTTHGSLFTAVVARGLVMGAQFHPERSSASGARLLKNFLSIS
ncbi:MAG: imidazole glycerol phosphate synthase subunit HisH [Vicinamibacteria bacterium]